VENVTERPERLAEFGGGCTLLCAYDTVTIATENLRHLGRFSGVDAQLWSAIVRGVWIVADGRGDRSRSTESRLLKPPTRLAPGRRRKMERTERITHPIGEESCPSSCPSSQARSRRPPFCPIATAPQRDSSHHAARPAFGAGVAENDRPRAGGAGRVGFRRTASSVRRACE
jgi:hypothetical protein